MHFKYILTYDCERFNFSDFKEKGIAKERGRDHASLEMDTTLITAIRQLTIIHHSVIVSAIYRLGRDHYRDIP